MKTEPEGKGAQVAAFSPNGKWLVKGGDALTMWDTATKKRSLESRRSNHGLSRSAEMVECSGWWRRWALAAP